MDWPGPRLQHLFFTFLAYRYLAEPEKMNDDSADSQFDEDLECRICRGGLEVGTLLHPCKCAGSIRYVHEDCIKLWLQRTRAKNCELCHHPFKFSPVYAPDTPSRLPTSTFLLGFLRIFGKHLLLLLRLVCALELGQNCRQLMMLHRG
jgi:E3 ubiquitin-protein ligase MARCH6